MARVTVEDCLKHVDNRFNLVIAATKRARQISKEGVDPLVPWDGDKPTVVALREIAEDLLAHQEDQKVSDEMQKGVNEKSVATTRIQAENEAEILAATTSNVADMAELAKETNITENIEESTENDEDIDE